MLRIAAACIVSSLILSLPAMAQPVPLQSSWVGMLNGGETAPPSLMGDSKNSSGTVVVGDMPITLEVTPLAAIAERFGGQVRHWGEAGEATSWLCYSWGAGSLWFYSAGEGGEGKPTTIALDGRNGAEDADQCASFAGGIPSITFDFAAIGDLSDEIMARYGQITPGEDGSFSYESLSPFADRPQVKEWQAISFREADGKVEAIAVSQEATD